MMSDLWPFICHNNCGLWLIVHIKNMLGLHAFMLEFDCDQGAYYNVAMMHLLTSDCLCLQALIDFPKVSIISQSVISGPLTLSGTGLGTGVSNENAVPCHLVPGKVH
jgi:hypothetical protein